MEVFGFTHIAVNYEDPGPTPTLRQFDEIELSLPKAAVFGVAGSAAALSVMVTAPDAQAVVRRGDVCPAVGDVQAELSGRGYSPGGIDDNFGQFTELAVRNFQRDRGLSQDGVVGPATADLLGLAAPGSPFEFGNGCFSEGGGTGGGSNTGVATVTASSLNIRSGPSLSNPVIGSLLEGTRVEVLRTAGGWSEIADSAAGEAWVSSAFLSGSGTGGGGTGGGGAIGDFVEVTVSGLNVRARPTTSSAVISGLSSGDRVEVLDRSGAWLLVDAGGVNGWVDSFYTTGSFSGGTGGGGTGGGGLIDGGQVSTSSGLGANVRSFPNGPVVGGLADGTSVLLTGAREFAGGIEWLELTSGDWIATSVLVF